MAKNIKFPRLVLTLGFDNPSGQYGFVHVRGWLNRDDNRSIYHDDGEGGKFKGLTFSAQGDEDTLASAARSDPMYGYDLEWTDTSRGLGLPELKKGVTALTFLERKMNEASDAYGPPSSLGTWVQRVASVIGLDKVSLGGEIVSPARAARSIDDKVREWQVAARRRKGMDENGQALGLSA